MTTRKADAIADLVLSTFRSLPKRFKPRSTHDRPEWVPVAGIVLSKDFQNDSSSPTSQPPSPEPSEKLQCVALATGMKCHPYSKLPHLQGGGLHDSHAEVLALRAFNRFLLDECADLAAGTLGSTSSKWLQWRREGERLSAALADDGVLPGQQHQPFELRDGVSIHMYCSEAPCGDASMELIMRRQEDSTPWPSASTTPSTNTESTSTAAAMLGRAHFDRLGAVRRKPSRPDAPPSRSKSCTDKLALKQCTGLLSSITAQLIWPGNIHLSSLILPESEYVPAACERAFGVKGRMAPLVQPAVRDRWRGMGFAFRPFDVETTSAEFEFSKRGIELQERADGNRKALQSVPSNRSCVYTPRLGEVLINGVLEGRKWNEIRGASALSRRKMWASAAEIAAALNMPSLAALTREGSRYSQLKGSQTLKAREEVKADVRALALQGWVRNDGDEEWTLGEQE